MFKFLYDGRWYKVGHDNGDEWAALEISGIEAGQIAERRYAQNLTPQQLGAIKDQQRVMLLDEARRATGVWPGS